MMRIALAATLLLGSPLAATATTEPPEPLAATATSTATTEGNRSGLPFMLGVFAHDRERAAKFEQVVGVKAGLYQMFPDRGGGMTSTLASTWMFDGVPDGVNIEVAADLWDAPASDWAAFATMIRDAGYAAPWITLGHEFNLPGGWEQATLTADEFKSRFIRAHDAIKTVLPDASILWAPNTGQGGIPEDFYPGDQYVDMIGLSAYMWASEDWLGQKGGMDEYAAFARGHGKKIFLREWGNAKAGADGRGDDPAAMDLTFDWAKVNADVFAGVGYFDETADYFQSSVGGGQMPETGKRLKEIFAGYGSGRPAAPDTSQGAPTRGDDTAETAGNPAAAAQRASPGRDDGGAADTETTSSDQPGPEPRPTAAAGPVEPVRDQSWTDQSGTSSTYHLSPVESPRGLVVYLDGDGMYGHDNPDDSYALGGPDGVAAKAAAVGYAAMSVRTPDAGGTFWRDGDRNAAYVAALIAKVKSDLGVTDVALLGYSGGSQLVTKWLLPQHPDVASLVVVTGGGGAPGSVPASTGALLVWHTGADDDGRGTGDGYDAIGDAKAGASAYRAAGWAVAEDHPAGVAHDLGGQFGAILARHLTPPQAQESPAPEPSAAVTSRPAPAAPPATSGAEATETGATHSTPSNTATAPFTFAGWLLHADTSNTAFTPSMFGGGAPSSWWVLTPLNFLFGGPRQLAPEAVNPATPDVTGEAHVTPGADPVAILSVDGIEAPAGGTK